MRVKICGVRDLGHLDKCLHLMVDMIGLNLVPGANRAVAPDMARTITARLKGRSTVPVGVFLDQPMGEVVGLAQTIGLRWLQLHGGESAAYCRELAKDFMLVKAVGLERLRDQAGVAAYVPHVQAFLVDGRRPGSGESWDWVALRRPPYDHIWSLGPAIWLAGGLRPENVAAAIEAVRPAVVDSASGVEVAGELDPLRLGAFCRAARGPGWSRSS